MGTESLSSSADFRVWREETYSPTLENQTQSLTLNKDKVWSLYDASSDSLFKKSEPLAKNYH